VSAPSSRADDVDTLRLRRLVQAGYALQALSVVLAVFGDGVFITTLVVVLPASLGYLLGRLRPPGATGSTLEPHLLWQARSFTRSALSLLAATIVLGPLLFIGLSLLWFAYALVGLWLAWRVATGAWSLWNSRPLPGTQAADTRNGRDE
jgi:uncharacterized membrane protein